MYSVLTLEISTLVTDSEKPQEVIFDVIKKYPHFFHTEEEIKALLERFYTESGGKGEWRFFSLEGIENWNMKYIRIWRTELGFIVCDSYNRAYRKSELDREVSKTHLDHH